MKKLILLTILMITLSGCEQDSNDKVKLMLDYTPNTNHTGFYVADALGYYDDVGIDLEILQPGDTQVESLVANQKVDFAISYEDQVASAIDKGIDIKALSTITNTATTGAVTRSDKEYDDPSDWNEATYCGWGAPIEEAYVKAMANKYGGDSSKLNIQEANQSFLADTGVCDIFWGYTNWELIQANIDGIDYDYTPASEIVDYYPVVLVTSDKLIAENSDLVQRFVSATKKGFEYAASNPGESASIFLEANPEFDEQLINESQEQISPLYVDDSGQFGYIDEQVWNNFTQFMIDSELVDEENRDEINDGYTNKFVEEA